MDVVRELEARTEFKPFGDLKPLAIDTELEIRFNDKGLSMWGIYILDTNRSFSLHLTEAEAKEKMKEIAIGISTRSIYLAGEN